MRDLARQVKKLKKQTNHVGNMNSGDTVEADYFALKDLLDYYDESREAARRVIVARDALQQVFFRLDNPKVKK